jgi:hypothetical protein
MGEGENQKSPIKFVLFWFNLFTTTTNAKKPLPSITSLTAAAFGLNSLRASNDL